MNAKIGYVYLCFGEIYFSFKMEESGWLNELGSWIT
jgi:hypothetical protein